MYTNSADQDERTHSEPLIQILLSHLPFCCCCCFFYYQPFLQLRSCPSSKTKMVHFRNSGYTSMYILQTECITNFTNCEVQRIYTYYAATLHQSSFSLIFNLYFQIRQIFFSTKQYSCFSYFFMKIYVVGTH